MIVILKKGATEDQIQTIESKIKDLGWDAHIIRGEAKTVIGVVGQKGDRERVKALVNYEFVDDVMSVDKPYKLASRTTKQEDSVVTVNGVSIGGKSDFVVIAGPC